MTHHRILKGVAIASVLALVTSCGGGGGHDTTTAPISTTPVLTSVTISGSGSLDAGKTLQLAAAAKDQAGSAIAAAITWSSSASGTATVSVNGLVTGLAPGTVTVTATARAGVKTVTASVQITIVDVARVLTAVNMTAPGTLVIGGTGQSTVSAVDQLGAALAATVVWSSTDQNIATVSQAGVVTGIAAGTASIRASATAGGVTIVATRVVTVVSQIQLTSVSVSPTTPSVAIGFTVQLTATPLDQGGSPTSATVSWTSLNTGVATVSNTGLVTSVSPGSATIRATATSGSISVSNVVVVTVVNAPASADVNTAGNNFVPGDVEIARGGTVRWTFTSIHNVVFNPVSGAPDNIGETESGTVSRTFDVAGTFPYQCTLHSGMIGSVVVR